MCGSSYCCGRVSRCGCGYRRNRGSTDRRRQLALVRTTLPAFGENRAHSWLYRLHCEMSQFLVSLSQCAHWQNGLEMAIDPLRSGLSCLSALLGDACSRRRAGVLFRRHGCAAGLPTCRARSGYAALPRRRERSLAAVRAAASRCDCTRASSSNRGRRPLARLRAFHSFHPRLPCSSPSCRWPADGPRLSFYTNKPNAVGLQSAAGRGALTREQENREAYLNQWLVLFG